MLNGKIWTLTLCLLALESNANAQLAGRDINGNPVAANDVSAVMEYDPNLNITWLRDWNQNGAMFWATAQNWASTLTVGNFGGWSLPTINAFDTTCSNSFNPGGGFATEYNGTNCTGSPMGYLYYKEGITAAVPGPFLNIQASDYWSGTEYAPNPTKYAWLKRFDAGDQGLGDKMGAVYAVAIRQGDVAAAVPEPETYALMLAGVWVIGAVVRRRPMTSLPSARSFLFRLSPQ